LLRVSDVSASYGPIQALRGVSLEVSEGQIVALLGANGAGKSSTLKVISGILRPSGGSVEFLGQPIHRRSPESIVSLGISHVPEGRELFAELTVEENLRLGAYTRSDRNGIKRDMDRVYGYFPLLAERRKQPAGSLSGGEQQMLAIGRGLMARPKLLLLDEPSLGLAPTVVQEIFQIIKTINREEGLTVLLVEQNATMALRVSQYGYVLETGRIALAAEAAELKENESVRRSYLGY
jgi:branched-chain amino acid transport system ATP-binding protein